MLFHPYISGKKVSPTYCFFGARSKNRSSWHLWSSCAFIVVVESISFLPKLPAVRSFGWMVPLGGATQFHIISVDLQGALLLEEIPCLGVETWTWILVGRFSYIPRKFSEFIPNMSKNDQPWKKKWIRIGPLEQWKKPSLFRVYRDSNPI